jgi:hypothetical protein
MKINHSDLENSVEIPGTGIKLKPLQVWTCKVGVVDAGVMVRSSGLDFPMRQAVSAAFQLLFGKDPEFMFSGWNGDLSESERDSVNRRHE